MLAGVLVSPPAIRLLDPKGTKGNYGNVTRHSSISDKALRLARRRPRSRRGLAAGHQSVLARTKWPLAGM